MNQVPFIKSHYTGQTDLKVEGHSVEVLKAMICHYPDLGSITLFELVPLFTRMCQQSLSWFFFLTFLFVAFPY